MLSPCCFGTHTATLHALHSSSLRSSRSIRKADLHYREGRQENKTGVHVCCGQTLSCYITFSFLPTTALSTGIFPFQAVINMTTLKVPVGGSCFLNLLKCSSNTFISACGYSNCSVLKICTVLVSYITSSSQAPIQRLTHSPLPQDEEKTNRGRHCLWINIKTV